MQLRASSRLVVSTALLIALVGLFVGDISSQTTPPTLTMLSKDGRRPIPLTLVNDQEYVGLDDLASIFQLTVRDQTLGAVTVTYKNRTIVLTSDQPLASVSGRLVSLPGPPRRAGQRWIVPVEFIARALAPVYDTRLDLRKASGLLIVGEFRVPRVTLRYDATPPGARLTLDAVPRATSTVSQENDRLTLRFDADALDIAVPPMPQLPPQSLVQGVRLGDPTSLVIDLAPRTSFRVTSQPVDAATRVTIDLTPPAPDAAPGVAAAPPSQAPSPAEVPSPALGGPAASLRTIALDPGHGGEDEGVKTADGVKEKDLTLAVARRIKAVIEARLGIRVLLTRDDDRDVTLEDRSAIANNNKADLFISLHANASFQPSTSGATIYTAAFDDVAANRAGGSAASTGDERVATFGGGVRDIEVVPWERAQSGYLDQSASLAMALEQSFQPRVPLAPHPVERAPLAILESANMPAALVDMGFLTNAGQAKAMVGSEFQSALVEAVTDAVIKFRDLAYGGAR